MQVSRTVLLLLLTACFVALETTVVTAHGEPTNQQHHKCIHSHVASEHPITTIEQPLLSDALLSDASSHHMNSLAESSSTNTLSQPWRPIKITFDYSIAADPAKDKSSAGDARSCTSVGEVIKIGGSPTKDCIANKLTNDCLYTCESGDIVTTSVLNSLKSMMAIVEGKLQRILQVQSSASPITTVEHSPSQSGCDRINVTRRNVSDTNLAFFVTTRPLKHLGNTLAYAMSCATDPITGRPIMGTMNVAPVTITSNPDLADVLLHEASHALGFGPGMLRGYRFPGNNSKTYFEHDAQKYPTGPVSGDGVTNQGSGVFSVNYQLLGPGKKMLFIGPNTIAFARNYFNCETLAGVEWENGGNDGGSTASHWEKRLLYPELMTATQNSEPGSFSGFTLALFADMGFYQVNMSEADPMTWGSRKGCDWAAGCDKWSKEYFCEVVNGRGCSYNREASGACNLAVYGSALPAGYQHFPSHSTWGGQDEYADYCPIVKSFMNGICSDPSKPASGAVAYYFEHQSSSSRCFVGNAVDNRYQAQASQNGRCHEMVCITGGTPEHPSTSDGFSPLAVVNISGHFYPCNHDGKQFGLKYPPRSGYPDTYNFSAAEEVFISTGLIGEMNCGLGIESMCSGPGVVDVSGSVSASVVSSSLWRVSSWPTIRSVQGAAYGLSEGEVSVSGDTVTIQGRYLSQCTGASIGGVSLTGVSVSAGSTTTSEAATSTPSSSPTPPPTTDAATAPPPTSTLTPLPQLLNTSAVSKPPGIFNFFNGSGNVPLLPHPAQISSTFGPRFKNSESRYDFHRGIDYYDALDTPIFSTASGTVYQVHWEVNGTFVGGGNTIVVEYPLVNPSGALFHNRTVKKWFGYYMHLNHMNVTEVGANVTAGQQLGTMGQSGTTTFTHLHFEARLNGYCSYQYQVENNRTASPTSYCSTGYDPHVHPYLLVGPGQPVSGEKTLEQIEAPSSSDFVFSVRFNATRGHLDLDVIETDLGNVSFNLRTGVNITTIASLDDLENITSYLSLQPGVFRHTTNDTISYDLHFRTMPAFVELRDIYGNGIRHEVSAAESPAPATPVATPTPTTAPPTTVAPTSSPPAPVVIDVMTGTLAAFNGQGQKGGYGSGGTGNVTIELTCTIPIVCPSGCVAAISGNKVNLVVPPATTAPPTTSAAPTTSTPEQSTAAVPVTTDGGSSFTTQSGTTGAATGTNSPPTTTDGGESPSTAATDASSSSPHETTSSSTSGPSSSPSPSSTSSASPSPQASETPAPTDAPPNSVRFVVAKEKNRSPEQFLAALQTVMKLNTSDAAVASHRVLDNGDLEVTIKFTSSDQQSSALKLTDTEKDTLGIKSAAAADGGDSGSSGGFSLSELSREAWIGIGVGLFLVLIVAAVLMRRKNDSAKVDNAAADDQPMLQQPMMHQQQQNPHGHRQQQQGQYGRQLAPPAYRSSTYDDDIL